MDSIIDRFGYDIDLKYQKAIAPIYPDVSCVHLKNRLFIGAHVYVNKRNRHYYAFLWDTAPKHVGFDRLKQRLVAKVEQVINSEHPGDPFAIMPTL